MPGGGNNSRRTQGEKGSLVEVGPSQKEGKNKGIDADGPRRWERGKNSSSR